MTEELNTEIESEEDYDGGEIDENVATVTRYGIDISQFISDPKAAFKNAMRIGHELLAQLNVSAQTPPTAAEFKSSTVPTDETEERFAKFAERLSALFDEFHIYDDNEMLMLAGKHFKSRVQDCDNAIDLNLEVDHNLRSQETLSRKQIHRDYMNIRKLLPVMAKMVNYKGDVDLPKKGGNFSDDLPLAKAEATFYAHAYELQVFEPVADSNGRVIDYDLVNVYEYRPGVTPIRMAHHLGLLNLILRSGFLAFFRTLTTRFAIPQFSELPADYDSLDDPFVWESDSGKVFCLHVSPIPKAV